MTTLDLFVTHHPWFAVYAVWAIVACVSLIAWAIKKEKGNL